MAIFLISTPRIFQCAKLHEKLKKKLLSYLKSPPWNLRIFKISRKKQKCLNFGLKMLYLGIFLLEL